MVFLKSFLIFCLFLSESVLANAGRVKGEIEYVRVHEDGHANGAWSPPVFWFSLKGVKNVGNCVNWGGSGTTLFVANGEMFYSMILAAQAQGNEIAVAWDDVQTKNGYCRALFITSGNPPSLK